MALPTGTTTFLLTDIQGSTRLWEQYPEPMREAAARHDALTAAVVQQHGGTLVKSRGEGDSLFAVFARAPDAVAAAADAQQRLHAEPWPTPEPLRVRMALHTGEAELREGDYYGAAVNRCARLRAAAHGGQVVLSEATHAQAQEDLPAGVRFRELGVHRLKDLQLPVRLFQLVHLELPGEFPPLRSLEAFAHNLPVQLTSFIGRETQITEVKRLLQTTRLLTLTGTGGCGKTRLSLQVAADLVDDLADGAWQVELAPLSDAELLPQVVASALGVREEPGRPLVQTLIDYLRPRRLILLLDNCEHLIQACARHADALLRGCPGLILLATSREALGIGGETVYRVPSLSLPDPDELARLPVDPVPLVTQYESAQLFVERAQSLLPGFTVTPQSARSLAEVCRRLDGIPLAIELAAARVKLLPLEQIAIRVEDAFRLLTGGSRTALPQHQTLRALIDWSYHLLSEPERALLRRLSVFAGGWTLEAAEAVCAEIGAKDGDIEPWEILDLLSRLVDKSLVIVDDSREGESRYRLLETVRQYSREKLEAAGEMASLRERHLHYFLRVAEEVYPGFFGATQPDSARRLGMEHDNLRAALAGCGEGSLPPLVGLQLTGALWWFWLLQSLHSEARRWLEQAMVRAGGHLARSEWPEPLDAESARIWARALLGAGGQAMFLCDFEPSRRMLDASIALSRQQGDEWALALTLRGLGWTAIGQEDYRTVQAAGAESIERYRQMGDEAGLARSINLLAHLARRQGDLDRAAGLWTESLALARRSGDRWMIGTALANLAKITERQRDFPQARSLYEESLRLRRELGEKRGIAECLEGLAAIILPSIESPGWPAWDTVRPISLEVAAQWFGAAAALREAIGAPGASPMEWHVSREPAVAALRAALGDTKFSAAWTLGRSMRLDRALALALPGRE